MYKNDEKSSSWMKKGVIGLMVAAVGVASYGGYSYMNSQTAPEISSADEAELYYYGNSCDIDETRNSAGYRKCYSDYNCKGDRKCSAGKYCYGFDHCPSASQCSFWEKSKCTWNSDCRGNRVCSFGNCKGFSRC
uniref:Uncharacterized protein n=1 Tax=Strombidium inclinatum TaxID=197538 RepID=A0A7S3MZ30_9SPIT|mmetsp:Transcript_30934/g.47305  ORF Transcript_30934/g.47305 Transcript_30934/m.47305 type:complete len:134 (+) Transcript_30934:38-439(+)